MEKINIGLIGYKLMGTGHSQACVDMPKFFTSKAVPVMKTICGRDEKAVKETSEKYGWKVMRQSGEMWLREMILI